MKQHRSNRSTHEIDIMYTKKCHSMLSSGPKVEKMAKSKKGHYSVILMESHQKLIQPGEPKSVYQKIRGEQLKT